jgi:hypothetical protein
VRGELLCPGRRDVPGLHGDDDLVERAVPGRAVLPVRAERAHVAVPGQVQAGLTLLPQPDLDGGPADHGDPAISRRRRPADAYGVGKPDTGL